MKRNFVVGMFGGLIGSALLLILLSAAGIVGARGAEVARSDVARSDSAALAAPAGGKANLTYQGRLTNSSGAPINTTVNIVFKLYNSTPTLLWTSATRSVTPVNGLFTVYLGDGADPDLPYITLSQAASIGVMAGSDAEMTPRQALRSVVGHSLNEVGVVGSSDTGFGVFGSSNSLAGVVGSSNSGDGVSGQTGDPTRAGVLAQAAGNSGIALEISRGGIKATGAGGGTSTFAFIHVSSPANILGFDTQIDNALTNGDQNAMLFVTHVFNPTGVADNYYNKAFGVYYSALSLKWTIYEEDGQPFPAGITFNVMVIKR